MACILLTGFETGDASELISLAGTSSIQASTVRTGGYAFRSNPTTTGTGSTSIRQLDANGRPTISNFGNSYTRFYFRYATKAASGDEPIFTFSRTSKGGTRLGLRLNSSGNIAVYASGSGSTPNTLKATGTIVLSANTWYRIEVKCDIAAGWEVKIDGVSDTTGADTANVQEIVIGKSFNVGGNSVDYFYDDLYVDSAAYPGIGQCNIMLPTGDGNYTANWTASAGNKYQCVDEIPHNSDTDFISCTTNTAAYTAAMQDSAVVGMTGTINAVKAVLIAKQNGGSAGSIKCRIRGGSTDSDTGGAATSSSYITVSKYASVDPSTSAAWTSSGLDALEVGAVENSANGDRITGIYGMVDWRPAVDAGSPDNPAYRTNMFFAT